ncbi:MAG: phosphatidate cytidylyltransferase [Nitrospirales bacterium]|nr:MAG: phosphatidate cytidylyltransferase [Nitrospirales bacterium]
MKNDPRDSSLSSQPGSPEAHSTPHRFTLQRVYPALIFAPLFYVFIRYFPPLAFWGLIVLVAGLAFWEFTKVTLSPPPTSRVSAICIGSIGILLAVIQWTTSLDPIMVATVVVVALLMAFMLAPQQFRQRLPRPAAIVFGIGYIGLCLGHLLLIRKLPSGDLLIFFVIVVTWAADTGGYYIGASMGKRPIAPRLSPKKTVEGFLAGIIFSVILAIVSHVWFLPSLPLFDCLIIGILLACVGLLGDLAESAFKRSAGVKDSGSLIPGHGGILDRIDSLLLTAPAFYYYILLSQNPAHYYV